jgi:hypothetical protein
MLSMIFFQSNSDNEQVKRRQIKNLIKISIIYNQAKKYALDLIAYKLNYPLFGISGKLIIG